jgi:lysophospholipase L1-like esterase
MSYTNKYFSILGDSISTLEGYNPRENAVFYEGMNKVLAEVFHPTDTWWGRVIDNLGGELLANESFSGSTVCRHPAYEIESYGSSDARTGALGSEGKLPDVVMVFMGINDRGRRFPTEKFLSEYRLMLGKIKKNAPKAEIWCINLPSSAKGDAYCDAIAQAAAECGARLLDVSDIEYASIDGLHPDNSGMKTIADAVISAIKT